MNQIWVLFKQQLRLQRVSLIVWSLLLFLMAWGTASSAPAATGLAAEKLMKSFGMDAFSGGGPSDFKHAADWFINVKLLSWLPLFISIYAALSALAVVSKDEDAKTAEFVLSLPVSKSRVIVGRMLGICVSTAIVSIMVVAALAGALPSVGMKGSIGLYSISALAGYFVSMGIGAVALYLSLVISAYSKALRYSLGLIASFFLYDIVLKLASPKLAQGILGKLTPFGWFDSTAILKDGVFPWFSVIGGALLVIAFMSLSIGRFEKREVL